MCHFRAYSSNSENRREGKSLLDPKEQVYQKSRLQRFTLKVGLKDQFLLRNSSERESLRNLLSKKAEGLLDLPFPEDDTTRNLRSLIKTEGNYQKQKVTRRIHS